MTTQTEYKRPTARDVVEGRIRSVNKMIALYEQNPFWDLPVNRYGKLDFTVLPPEERTRIWKERVAPIYSQGGRPTPLMVKLQEQRATLVAHLRRMNDVAKSTSYTVMDQARRVDAINEHLPEGQKLTGNESWSWTRNHVEDIAGMAIADKFFHHNTWKNFRGLPDNDALYQKLMRASEELMFTNQEKSSKLYSLALKIADRKMSEEQYTALSNENHALWRNLASVLQDA